MSLGDLHRRPDAAASTRPGVGASAAEARLDEAFGFTLDHEDAIDASVGVSPERVRAARARYETPEPVAPEHESPRDPREENVLYVAMGLGIACTVLALAMLLIGASS